MKRALKTDPTKWSKSSRQSLAAVLKKEYVDITYSCWRCGKSDVFSAEEQKYAAEVKKKHIDQRRILCQACWAESNNIRKAISQCEHQWSRAKISLQKDNAFLKRWLDLLVQLEQYVPYRPDTAKKNMLSKLIARNA